MTSELRHEGMAKILEIMNKGKHEQSEQVQTTTIQWPEVHKASKYIKHQGWENYPAPQVLNEFPDDLQIPHKLHEILIWSMSTGYISADTPAPPLHEAECAGLKVTDETHLSIPATESGPSEYHQLNLNYSVKSSTQGVKGSRPEIAKDSEKAAWTAKLKTKVTRKPVSAPTKLPPPPPVVAECTSCYEELREIQMTRLEACRHNYCKLCLKTLITTAMTSESSFPPKCCLTAIPLQTILLSLNREEREEYKHKHAEFGIPPNERWYCPRTTCLKWMPPSKMKANRKGNYVCPYCSETICRTCRAGAHARNAECPQDFGLAATLEIAQVEGWQRCYSCQALVEHTHGCRHMTCKCRAEFCYVCGSRWPTCRCTEADALAKRAGVQQRREARLATINEEEEEIARAIAEVQELERREAEERRLAEERQAREEEEMLAVLEAQRLQEEADRQAAAEQAEKEWLATLILSIADEWQVLQDTFTKILEYQKAGLCSKHEAIFLELRENMRHGDQIACEKFALARNKVTKKSKARLESLSAKHIDEVTVLTEKQEEEEDDLFVKAQVRLRGKPNIEARTERMLEVLRSQQTEQREEMDKIHAAAIEKIKFSEAVDLDGLGRAREAGVQSLVKDYNMKLHKLGRLIGAERHLFEIVTTRRQVMLARHLEIVLEEVGKKQEPFGLQEAHALKCEPFLPEVNTFVSGPSDTLNHNQTIASTAQLSENSKEKGRQILVSMEIGETAIPENLNEQNTVGRCHNTMPGAFPAEKANISLQTGSSAAVPNSTSPGQSESPKELWLLADKPLSIPDSEPSVLMLQSGITTESHSLTSNSSSSFHTASIGVAIAASSETTPPARNNSVTATIVTVSSDGGNTRKDPIVTASVIKKSKWSFRKSSKDLSPEEIRMKMKSMVGDAFF